VSTIRPPLTSLLVGLATLAVPAAAAPLSTGSLELTVAVEPTGPRILAARPVAATADPRRTGTDAVALYDRDGSLLGEASLPDPRRRSSIPAPGTEGHDHAVVHLERGVVTVRVPWSGAAPAEARYRNVTLPMPQLTSAGPLPPPGVAELIQDAGPSDERLDMVFLGDGYTEDQLSDYADDVDRMTSYLLSIEPYGAYADLFNIWRIDVVSNQTGASHFDQGQNETRDTALGCYYGCGGIDRLTCCDDGAVMSLVGDLVPGADGIMVLINDQTYGGSGGFNYATSYIGDDYGPEVAAHELGHSLIGLWDEYGYGGSGSGDGPNCSSDPDGAWDSWKGVNGVDAYPECSWSNLYRPTNTNCMMNTLQDDYCPVCRQEAVLEMYRRLPGLVSSVSPAPDPELVVDGDGTGRGDVQIEVATHAPSDTLSFSWQLDGEEVSDEATLDVSCADLEGEVTLVVSDPTPWVRDDPEGLLTQELGPWNVRSGTCQESRAEKAAEALGCSTAGSAGASAWLLLGGLALARRGQRQP